MQDEEHDTLQLYNLSRRRVLGGIGAIGIASAGAGLGTSAYFADAETFEGNSLVAGSLDLKVDWEEHYYRGFADDLADLQGPEGGAALIQVSGQDPTTVPEGYVGLPDPEQPLVAVYEGALDQFMANTAIEAFPDPDDDSNQETWTADFRYLPCEMGADTPEHLDPTVENALRTHNADTYDEEAGAPKPLVSLDDVKPGDFGELTLSFHLCDNPGYVWLQGVLDEALENGITEPEGADSDEDQTLDADGNLVLKDPEDADGATVELLDAIQTVWWYDSRGDNVLQTGCEEELYLTDSGTEPTTLFRVDLRDDGDGQRAELTELWPNGDTAETDFDQTDAIAATPDGKLIYFYDKNSGHLGEYSVGDDSFVDLGAVGGNPGGIVLAGFAPDGTLWAASQDTNKLYTVDTAGPSVTTRGNTGIELQGADLAFAADGTLYLWTAASGDQGLYRVDDPSMDTTAVPVNSSAIGGHSTTITGLAIRDAGTGDLVASDRENDDIVVIDRTTGTIVERYPMVLPDGSPYPYHYGDMTVGSICGEVFRRGTLREDLERLGTGLGIPLDGNRATAFDEITDNPASPNRECFVPEVTHYVGFAWWLPLEVGNEIQSDSVGFDLGFYTEQCRHNDGGGIGGGT